MERDEAIAVGVVVAAVVAITAIILIAAFTIKSSGRIRSIGIEVYSDPVTKDLLETIWWGDLDPGETATITVYIGNPKTISFDLSLSTSNWAPANASDYLTLTWNYEGQIVNPGDILPVTLYLEVSPSIVDVDIFSFDITITGTEIST